MMNNLEQFFAERATLPEPTPVQTVRLIDVWLLGPFMIWFGARAQEMPGWARAAMVVSGGMTMLYNRSRYEAVRAFEERR